MEFKEFKIEELFEVKTTKGLDEGKLTFSESGDYNFVGRTKKNNGIKGRISKQSFDANSKNTISVSQIGTITACYQPEEWYGSQNMFCLTSKNELTKNKYLYFVAVLNAYLRQYANSGRSVYPTLASLKNAKIQLPITPSGEIDFDYMEQYIEKIEKQYIEKIALLLKASGLDNYQLTEEEKVVLKEEKEKKEFKIEELFEYKTGDVDLQKTDLTETGEWVVTAGTTNYGLLGKTTKTAKIISKNTITIDMFGCAFYRNFDYKMVTHARVFALIPKIKCSERVGLFLTGSLAYLKKLFSYQNMCSFSKIKDLTIQLPITSTGEIDFDYMEKYISAIIKTKIKNVVLEINKKLKLYKQTQN